MVRKRDQIIYKLPDNMQVAAIGEEQRQQLMKEIQALHQATMAAAASAQQKQQQDIKPIAPKSDSPSLDTPPQPTAAEADAIKETARKLREELEQQQYHMKQQQQMFPYDSNPSSPHDNSKTTRRYNKTGKYSKKKQQQLQQQLHQQFNQQLQQPYLYQQQQQQQLTQQQLIALQQSLQNNNTSTPSTPITSTAASTPISANTPNTAFPFPPLQQQDQSIKSSPAPTPPPSANANQRPTTLQQPDSILSKRLPEEEIQHREVKKRYSIAKLLCCFRV